MAGICTSYKEQLLYEKNTSAAFSGFLEPFVLYIFFPGLWMPFKPVLPFTGRAWEHLYNDNWNVLHLLHFTANQENKNPLFSQLSVDLQWWNCSEAALTGMWGLAEPGEGICLPCTLSPPWASSWGFGSLQLPAACPTPCSRGTPKPAWKNRKTGAVPLLNQTERMFPAHHHHPPGVCTNFAEKH